ncbi:MAG: methyltransferase protein [Bacteroidetes bacterium]|nr:methyltransferase protein [Bacteroidota bacterium]
MNHNLNETYWNNRYLNNEFSWDVGHVSTPLKEYFDQLTDKSISILIPGAGNSYEAEYLVNNGFPNVYVCDFAEEPLKNLQQRCPLIKKENLWQIDFFDIFPSQNAIDDNSVTSSVVEKQHTKINDGFDLIIEQTFFCAIDPSLRRKYFEKMNQLLKPGGKLVGLLFNDILNSDKPPFGGSKEEYKKYFEDLFKINVYEPSRNSIKPREGRELFINLEKSKET